jgi:hypothetical protein
MAQAAQNAAVNNLTLSSAEALDPCHADYSKYTFRPYAYWDEQSSAAGDFIHAVGLFAKLRKCRFPTDHSVAGCAVSAYLTTSKGQVRRDRPYYSHGDYGSVDIGGWFGRVPSRPICSRDPVSSGSYVKATVDAWGSCWYHFDS